MSDVQRHPWDRRDIPLRPASPETPSPPGNGGPVSTRLGRVRRNLYLPTGVSSTTNTQRCKMALVGTDVITGRPTIGGPHNRPSRIMPHLDKAFPGPVVRPRGEHMVVVYQHSSPPRPGFCDQEKPRYRYKTRGSHEDDLRSKIYSKPSSSDSDVM